MIKNDEPWTNNLSPGEEGWELPLQADSEARRLAIVPVGYPTDTVVPDTDNQSVGENESGFGEP